MSHIPNAAMPHAEAKSESGSRPEQPVIPTSGAAADTAFKAGAWLALGAGLAAAVTAAIVHRAHVEPGADKPKRRRKAKAD